MDSSKEAGNRNFYSMHYTIPDGSYPLHSCCLLSKKSTTSVCRESLPWSYNNPAVLFLSAAPIFYRSKVITFFPYFNLLLLFRCIRTALLNYTHICVYFSLANIPPLQYLWKSIAMKILTSSSELQDWYSSKVNTGLGCATVNIYLKQNRSWWQPKPEVNIGLL